MHWHSDAVFAFDDVREEVGPVGFGGNAAVDFFHVQGEDFGLAGFHRFGDHESDKLVERGELLAGGVVSKISLIEEEIDSPDVDECEGLEGVENESNPFREASGLETFEGFPEGQIANQVESSPDVPFEHVDRIRGSGCFNSFAQFVDEKRCEMLQDISLI